MASSNDASGRQGGDVRCHNSFFILSYIHSVIIDSGVMFHCNTLKFFAYWFSPYLIALIPIEPKSLVPACLGRFMSCVVISFNRL